MVATLSQPENRNAIGTHLNQVQDLFSRWDRDRSGTIDKDEFRKAMRAFQLPGSDHSKFYDAVCDTVFGDYDVDASGVLTYSEYIRQTLRGALQRSTTRVTNLFRLWDADNSGNIDKQESSLVRLVLLHLAYIYIIGYRSLFQIHQQLPLS